MMAHSDSFVYKNSQKCNLPSMRISPLNSTCEFEHYNYHLGIDQPCNHENKGRCASDTIETLKQ